MLILMTSRRFRCRILQAERYLRPEEHPDYRVVVVYTWLGVVWFRATYGGTVRLLLRSNPRRSGTPLLTVCHSIAGRAVQGIGGSGLYSLAQVCLLEQGPSRPEVVGALVGITLSVSFVLGPLLGGAISEWNWRGIFWFKLVLPLP